MFVRQAQDQNHYYQHNNNQLGANKQSLWTLKYQVGGFDENLDELSFLNNGAFIYLHKLTNFKYLLRPLDSSKLITKRIPSN